MFLICKINLKSCKKQYLLVGTVIILFHQVFRFEEHRNFLTLFVFKIAFERKKCKKNLEMSAPSFYLNCQTKDFYLFNFFL